MSALRIAPAAIPYPETDGQPMAETDVQRDEMVNAIFSLNELYRDDPQVYVGGNLLIYYEEGDLARTVAPDVFVVFGIAKRQRRIYKLWEAGKLRQLRGEAD